MAIIDNRVRGSFRDAGRNLQSVKNAVVAGAAGVGILVANLARFAREKASALKPPSLNKKGDTIAMKKSTLVALLIALAAVIGVLIALYLYVIRRERELDEYEQLLFSEDFGADLPESFGDE